MALNLNIPEQQELRPRITVFGVGGAGGNAVNNMIAKALEGAEFVVANTDAQALAQSEAPAKVQLGASVTQGLGAGARPEIGAAAAEESLEAIIDHLAGANMCFITAGMGGGTGTGGAPVIAKAARELGVLTVGVVTKPFQFEGAKRMRQAEAGIDELQRVVDTLIVIPNQNLFRLANEKTTFTEAFSMADDVLYQGVKGVTDLMVRPGIINLDFADIRSVMDEMGKAMMGTGEAEGEDRAIQAAERAIANPLLDEVSLKGAKGVLINITGGDDLTLFELDEAANRIRSEVDADANIIIGSTLDPDMVGRMRVSVVATGIDVVEGEEEGKRPTSTAVSARASQSLERQAPKPEPRPEPLQQPAAREYVRREAAPQPVAEEEAEPERAFPPAATTDDDDAEIAAARVAAAPEPVRPVVEVAPESVAVAQPRRPGEPSPEVLARLKAAVNRAPSGASAQRPAGAHGHAEDHHGRFGINSLIQRVTGQPHRDPRQDPAVRVPPPLSADDEDYEAQGERERIEIPAFLRRQAN